MYTIGQERLLERQIHYDESPSVHRSGIPVLLRANSVDAVLPLAAELAECLPAVIESSALCVG